MIFASEIRILELEHKLAETDKLLDAALNKLDALSPHGKCACSYDSKDDLCMHHSPKLSKAVAELADAKTKLAPNPACPHGHLMAMWVEVNEYSPINGINLQTGEAARFGGYCLSCREIEDAVREYRTCFADLAVEMEKHSNDHIRDEAPYGFGAAVEGVCADRIRALLEKR